MAETSKEINVMTLDVVSQSPCFGGTQFTYQHQSSETGTPMRFAAFVPPQADKHPVPVVWYLSGLTCTEENFTVKAGAQRIAAEVGLLLIAPDTSPRGDVAGPGGLLRLRTRSQVLCRRNATAMVPELQNGELY
jgi:S-formylglutathione hydrolase FrmB